MKCVYKEKYRKGAFMLRDWQMPKLHHTTMCTQAESVEVMEIGILENKNQRQEYQIIKLWFKPEVKRNGL